MYSQRIIINNTSACLQRPKSIVQSFITKVCFSVLLCFAFVTQNSHTMVHYISYTYFCVCHPVLCLYFSLWRNSPPRARVILLLSFQHHTQGHTTVGRTMDEGSARRRDLYHTIHNIHDRQTPMPPAGFEPAVSASERPQTLALDRSATGIGTSVI